MTCHLILLESYASEATGILAEFFAAVNQNLLTKPLACRLIPKMLGFNSSVKEARAVTVKPIPTGRELEILKVLWEDGPSSVSRVFHRLAAAQEQDLAYNTVQTLLRLMEDKGLVSHGVQGRTFIYTANYSREDSCRRLSRSRF